MSVRHEARQKLQRVHHLRARCRPVSLSEHAVGLVGLDDPAPDEEAEHCTTKRFGERRRVVRGPRNEFRLRPVRRLTLMRHRRTATP